ncbi:MAG: helix-turn-helix domain-containing protein [Phycisphaeraceae bacterium]
MTLNEASRRLGLGYRQTKRLWRRYRAEGDGGLAHRLRGRAGNNRRLADARRGRALTLSREQYQGWGPTLAAEQMAARDDLAADHETLRRWLTGEGLWRARRSERRRHPRRARRECFGELVQLDGSDHRWFGPERARCTLRVMSNFRGWAQNISRPSMSVRVGFMSCFRDQD